MRRLLMLVSCLALAVAALPAAGTTNTTQGETIRWVINYNGNSIPGNAARSIEAAGGELVRTLPQVGVAIAVSADPDFVGQMRGDRRVHSVGEVPAISVPEVTVTRTGFTPAMVPDPPAGLWDLLWGIARVNAPAAWEAGITGSHDTVVAVIDTGIASNHPDVGPNLLFNFCFVSTGDHTTGDCTPYPSLSFHGTHVAGTVAATFGFGVVGVGPDLGLANYNVFELFEDEDGPFVAASFDSVWTAMIDAAQQGFDVINMSLGTSPIFFGEGRDAAASFTASNRVANFVRRAGTFIVSSAGNSAFDLTGPNFVLPADAPGIASVGATGIRPDPVFPQEGAFDVRAFYSNFGAPVTLVAPGGDCGLDDSCDPATRPANWFEFLVLSADVFTPFETGVDPECVETESCPIGWIFAAGTSMAAPHVSGVAGLVKDQNPGLSPNQVSAILRQTAERIGDRKVFGHGLVDAFAAATRR